MPLPITDVCASPWDVRRMFPRSGKGRRHVSATIYLTYVLFLAAHSRLARSKRSATERRPANHLQPPPTTFRNRMWTLLAARRPIDSSSLYLWLEARNPRSCLRWLSQKTSSNLRWVSSSAVPPPPHAHRRPRLHGLPACLLQPHYFSSYTVPQYIPNSPALLRIDIVYPYWGERRLSSHHPSTQRKHSRCTTVDST